jgi:hypothetical protein
MKLHLRRRKQPDPPLATEAEEGDALKNARQYAEEQGSLTAIFKKMGRENLDAPFKRD